MNSTPKTILAIETSCDETAVAVIDATENEILVRSHIVLSQAKLHEEFGGVFPNLAKREHARTLPSLIKKTLEESKLLSSRHSANFDEPAIAKLLYRDDTLKETLLPFLSETGRPPLDAIAVTIGPGLEPALWVGFNTARALSIAWNIPFYPMNHMEGHIAAALLSPTNQKNSFTLTTPPLPALAVLLSGGHTEFDLIRSFGSYERIGETLDDAVGEAYDKAARLMGLTYPGGPKIALLAEEARSFKTPSPVKLPRPMSHSKDLNMSFSGLKTAVRYAIEKISPLTDEDRRGLAGEFENAITEVLIRKTHAALETTGAESLILGGGVSANTFLRNAFQRLADEHNIPLLLPKPILATDNALMIAVALAGRFCTETPQPVDPADPHLAVSGTLRLS